MRYYILFGLVASVSAVLPEGCTNHLTEQFAHTAQTAVAHTLCSLTRKVITDAIDGGICPPAYFMSTEYGDIVNEACCDQMVYQRNLYLRENEGHSWCSAYPQAVADAVANWECYQPQNNSPGSYIEPHLLSPFREVYLDRCTQPDVPVTLAEVQDAECTAFIGKRIKHHLKQNTIPAQFQKRTIGSDEVPSLCTATRLAISDAIETKKCSGLDFKDESFRDLWTGNCCGDVLRDKVYQDQRDGVKTYCVSYHSAVHNAIIDADFHYCKDSDEDTKLDADFLAVVNRYGQGYTHCLEDSSVPKKTITETKVKTEVHTDYVTMPVETITVTATSSCSKSEPTGEVPKPPGSDVKWHNCVEDSKYWLTKSKCHPGRGVGLQDKLDKGTCWDPWWDRCNYTSGENGRFFKSGVTFQGAITAGSNKKSKNSLFWSLASELTTTAINTCRFGPFVKFEDFEEHSLFWDTWKKLDLDSDSTTACTEKAKWGLDEKTCKKALNGLQNFNNGISKSKDGKYVKKCNMKSQISAGRGKRPGSDSEAED